jgi:hypothetical protein
MITMRVILLFSRIYLSLFLPLPCWTLLGKTLCQKPGGLFVIVYSIKKPIFQLTKPKVALWPGSLAKGPPSASAAFL